MSSILNYFPVRECDHEINNDIVTVLYKKKKIGIIERTLFKEQSKKPHKIDLDEIGSFIWLQIDGKINVMDIIEIAKKHFGERIEPASERVELFINQMHKNKLITLYKKK